MTIQFPGEIGRRARVREGKIREMCPRCAWSDTVDQDKAGPIPTPDILDSERGVKVFV